MSDTGAVTEARGWACGVATQLTEPGLRRKNEGDEAVDAITALLPARELVVEGVALDRDAAGGPDAAHQPVDALLGLGAGAG